MKNRSDIIRFLVKEQINKSLSNSALLEFSSVPGPGTTGGLDLTPVNVFMSRVRATPREMHATVRNIQSTHDSFYKRELKAEKERQDALPVGHPDKFLAVNFDPTIHAFGEDAHGNRVNYHEFDLSNPEHTRHHFPGGYTPFDYDATYDRIVNDARRDPALNRGYVGADDKPTRKVKAVVDNLHLKHRIALKRAESAHYERFDLEKAEKEHNENERTRELKHIRDAVEVNLAKDENKNHPINLIRRQLERERNFLTLSLNPLKDKPWKLRLARNIGDFVGGVYNPYSDRQRPLIGHIGAAVGRGNISPKELGPNGDSIGAPVGDLQSDKGPA